MELTKINDLELLNLVCELSSELTIRYGAANLARYEAAKAEMESRLVGYNWLSDQVHKAPPEIGK